MSTDDGCGHHWGRNGEFCVAVGPITYRLKALAVNGASHLADLGSMLA